MNLGKIEKFKISCGGRIGCKFYFTILNSRFSGWKPRTDGKSHGIIFHPSEKFLKCSWGLREFIQWRRKIEGNPSICYIFLSHYLNSIWFGYFMAIIAVDYSASTNFWIVDRLYLSFQLIENYYEKCN